MLLEAGGRDSVIHKNSMRGTKLALALSQREPLLDVVVLILKHVRSCSNIHALMMFDEVRSTCTEDTFAHLNANQIGTIDYVTGLRTYMLVEGERSISILSIH